MPNWTSALKGGSGDHPKLEHKRVRVKQNEENGEIYFSYYNSETKLEEHIQAPIQGALIGTALLLEAYDNTMRKSYRSNYIFNSKAETTQVYKPDGTKLFDKSVTYADAKNKLHELTGNTKVFYVLFVYDLDQNETYGIYTNVSIAIDQHKKVSSGLHNGLRLVLTPKEYGKDTNISKKTAEMLGKLAMKNTPKFADMEVGKPISDEEAEHSYLMDVIEKFNKWSEVVHPADAPVSDIDRSNGLADGIAEKRNARKEEDDLSKLNPKDPEDDDLPF